MDELEKTPEICLKTRTYSGYIDQNEFVQRYYFIKKRINNSLTREELAFLMGRTPYFTIDYEELSTSTKLDLIDIDQLGIILTNYKQEHLMFYKTEGKSDISNEKRMVRVIQYEYANRIEYVFNHQWIVIGENKNLKLAESKSNLSDIVEETMSIITSEIYRLIREGYFDRKRSPLEIYNHIWQEHKYISNAWSASFLKDVIYRFVRNDSLIAIFSKAHFTFQIKN